MVATRAAVFGLRRRKTGGMRMRSGSRVTSKRSAGSTISYRQKRLRVGPGYGIRSDGSVSGGIGSAVRGLS